MLQRQLMLDQQYHACAVCTQEAMAAAEADATDSGQLADAAGGAAVAADVASLSTLAQRLGLSGATADAPAEPAPQPRQQQQGGGELEAAFQATAERAAELRGAEAASQLDGRAAPEAGSEFAAAAQQAAAERVAEAEAQVTRSFVFNNRLHVMRLC